MRIRFKVDYHTGEPILQINVSASWREIQQIYETLDPDGNTEAKYLRHALGVMIGKEDFEVKTENQNKD